MKITKLETFVVDGGWRAWTYVKVETDEGISGWGEGFGHRVWPATRTAIDGLDIHFLHVRSPHAGAMPLLLTHGWPGSVVEFQQVIGPLTDPTRVTTAAILHDLGLPAAQREAVFALLKALLYLPARLLGGGRS